MNSTEPVVEQLLAAIRVAAGQPTLSWARPPEPLTGGFWAQIWRIRLGGPSGLGGLGVQGDASSGLEGELVARVMPDAEVGARETAVQAHLAHAGFPTPAIRLSSGPSAELDRAWMLMDFAPGRPLLTGLSGTSALIRLPGLALGLPDRLARHSAALHRVDPEPLAASVEGEMAPQIERLRAEVAGLGRPDLAGVAEWLAERRSVPGRAAVCHGDLHPFNVLTGAEGDVIIDWSASRIADPAYDIAYTRLLLAHPPLATPGVLKPLLATAGRAIAARFTRTYNAIADTPVSAEQLAWYTDFHALRMLAEVARLRAGDAANEVSNHPFFAMRRPLAVRLSRDTGTAVSSR